MFGDKINIFYINMKDIDCYKIKKINIPGVAEFYDVIAYVYR